MAEYEELDRLSESLYRAAKQMEAGVLELRRVEEQLELRMEEAEALGAEAVLEGGTELTAAMEEWESRILQKYLETSQNNYMFEARLLIKFKDLLGRMAGANIPVTAGVREVTGDYLDEWAENEEDLEALKAEIRAFNQVLRSAGLPELYMGTPRPVT